MLFQQLKQLLDVGLILEQLGVSANDLITKHEAQQRLKEKQDLATDKAEGFIGFQEEDGRCSQPPPGDSLRQLLN